ncbi:Fur family transcriptional regulator, ferric uptake regulator [Lutibacter oricola]|uniref:Fur family transcriptional regulator, ferric uptake regulator n=1 Tax=Lutibacter oricola TaxID=762486 RepID=A0A1H3EV52_9FLAO|nr:transcriptional repressor [Lutibacter oricola]SDX82616.1 Fur family transcriptional regulator, ferric uptake regulator [Lutibacter oricola]
MGIIRKTKSVEALLNQFKNYDGAISVIELINRLNSEMNKTTIYRVLNKLEEDGILHSFLATDGNKWYAECKGCSVSSHHDVHPHFQCLECGKVDCLTMDINIPKIPNREIISSQLLIQGVCEKCLVN